jgi:hypothetical protein
LHGPTLRRRHFSLLDDRRRQRRGANTARHFSWSGTNDNEFRNFNPYIMTVISSIPALAGMLAPALFAMACATTPNASLRAGQCDILSPGTLGITASRIELAPGETLQLERPRLFVAPYMPPDTIPAGCEVRWSATGGATISDGGLLSIARDASPGSTVMVSAQVDTLVARQTVQVVDPAPNPLAGTWTQSDPPTCPQGYRPGDAIVRELVFNRGRTFTVTRTPFESYRDYWGTYTYDVSTGRLVLTVENGNSPPGFRTAALTARVAGGELILEGPVLVGPVSNTPDVCRTVFRRLGDPR